MVPSAAVAQTVILIARKYVPRSTVGRVCPRPVYVRHRVREADLPSPLAPPPRVLGPRHQLEVIRPLTQRDPAQVVDRQTLCDRAVAATPHHAMRRVATLELTVIRSAVDASGRFDRCLAVAPHQARP